VIDFLPKRVAEYERIVKTTASTTNGRKALDLLRLKIALPGA